ncbi:MAG: ATP synthase F0 subunit B, partial [Bdellovibrionales bacterium]|nr:ATP synthase F0 subunit B [Bdellovibrionales bacterium]
MEILTALGVNSTLGIQFIIFLVAYVFLTTLVFKPYHRAYEERVKRTEGNTDLAERILTESKDLELQFEQKARALNNETKIIFDHSRTEAMKEYDRMVSQARDRAKSIMEKTRLQIGHEFESAR